MLYSPLMGFTLLRQVLTIMSSFGMLQTESKSNLILYDHDPVRTATDICVHCIEQPLNQVFYRFIHTLRRHVAHCYQCVFSPDSRYLVTASKDSTLKIWEVQTGKFIM